MTEPEEPLTGPVREQRRKRGISPNPAERPRQIRSTDAMDPDTARNLEEVRLMTAMMAEHHEAIIRLSKKRRERVLALRDANVTYRLIAEAMGATSQAVYKVIRGDL